MRINRTIVTAALATAVLVAPACSDDDSTTTTEAGGDTSVVETTTTAAPDELTVEDPWIRAMPAASGMTAGYLTITSPIDENCSRSGWTPPSPPWSSSTRPSQWTWRTPRTPMARTPT